MKTCLSSLVTGKCKFDHISPILSALHWLPVKYRICFKMLLFVFKSLHASAPLYIVYQSWYNPTYHLTRSGQLTSITVGHLRLWPPDYGMCCLFTSDRHHQSQFKKQNKRKLIFSFWFMIIVPDIFIFLMVQLFLKFIMCCLLLLLLLLQFIILLGSSKVQAYVISSLRQV